MAPRMADGREQGQPDDLRRLRRCRPRAQTGVAQGLIPSPLRLHCSSLDPPKEFVMSGDTAAPKTHNETHHWRALDAAHHIHPFTNTEALNREGVRVITRAKGIYLWDSDGKRLIDGMSGLWCVQLGYGNRALAAAGCEALKMLPYYNHIFKTTNPWTAELAAKLAELL